MAKALVKVVQEVYIPKVTVHVIEDGKAYVVISPYRQSARGLPLLTGYKLRICNDGWYQVYDALDEKLHFRIGDKYVANISDFIKLIP